ncbi:hypothetical protein COLO4_04138 [Corchorus olitorius]|uniref:Uncharacterized protein n=1 Tax=Corchorus olitorius TaxID=93759 RepID=A0A1R3KV31_9ROSI|nr:hypothetical protein COLO4_04138 [Corchorus olitorius]
MAVGLQLTLSSSEIRSPENYYMLQFVVHGWIWNDNDEDSESDD